MSQRPHPAEYTMLLRKHGLDKPGLGTAAVMDLQALQSGPVDARPGNRNSSRKRSSFTTLGHLIRHKMAVFNAGKYEITKEGVAWLAALEGANCLP